jgi:hypothetical protein
MQLESLPPTFHATRDALQRVAVHIVARARHQATGRFGLRAAPGGFGSPDFGDSSRVRVSSGLLVVESAPSAGATGTARPIDGATLVELAAFAGVDLDAPLDVGHDTPDVGDPNEPIEVDVAAAAALGAWFDVVGQALDLSVADLGPTASATMVQLWPEHFDIAVDVAARPDRRANLGGSPGDGFHADPYAYVGPWTDDRPGGPEFWNAPFGAVLGYGELVGDLDPVSRIAEFLVDGVGRLAE